MKKWTSLVLAIVLAFVLIPSESAHAMGLGDFLGGLTSMFRPDTDDAYKVGETAQLGDVSIKLNNVYESRGNSYYVPKDGYEYVILEFSISNKGDEELSLSTLLSFSTWCDGQSYTISIEALAMGAFSGKIQLDCDVLPGKSVTGVIGYEIPSNWQTISVEYSNDVLFGENAVFAVSKE